MKMMMMNNNADENGNFINRCKMTHSYLSPSTLEGILSELLISVLVYV